MPLFAQGGLRSHHLYWTFTSYFYSLKRLHYSHENMLSINGLVAQGDERFFPLYWGQSRTCPLSPVVAPFGRLSMDYWLPFACVLLQFDSEPLPMLDTSAGLTLLKSCGSRSSVCTFHSFTSACSLYNLTVISLVRVGSATDEFFLKWHFITIRLQLQITIQSIQVTNYYQYHWLQTHLSVFRRRLIWHFSHTLRRVKLVSSDPVGLRWSTEGREPWNDLQMPWWAAHRCHCNGERTREM